MAAVVRNVSDDVLRGVTPCPGTSVGDMLDHIGGFALVFTAAAAKETGGIASQPPGADASRLGADWRSRIPRDLAALAEAWRDPEAWTGMTRAGGVDLPGEMAGVIVLDELVIHGWDLARATNQPYEPDAASLEAVHGFVTESYGPGKEATRAGIFGPPVRLPDNASLFGHVLGLTGRDPAWPFRST